MHGARVLLQGSNAIVWLQRHREMKYRSDYLLPQRDEGRTAKVGSAGVCPSPFDGRTIGRGKSQPAW
jgi:hypothetical protein